MTLAGRSERHFTGNRVVRDLVLGMADGLTVPFALAAGARAMGLGGYLAARSDPALAYMRLDRAATALGVSSVVTVVALLVFGYTKGRFTGARPVRSALQPTLIGGLAAGAAFALARALT